MFKSFRHKLQTTVLGGAIIIASFSIVSRLLGLIRDRLLAATFGAGDELDCYYAAFRLPDLIFNTFVLGAISAALIPVFLQYWNKNKEEAWQIANSVFNILLTFLVIIGGIFVIFAPQLMSLIVSGFSPEKQAITVRLTRIMMVGILFFGGSNVIGGILNSFRRFFAYALAPVMYNLGIIYGVLFLVPHSHLGIYGLGLGVVLGSFLHFLVQVPSVIRVGFRWKLRFNFCHPAIKKISYLMLPRCFALAIGQINLIVITFIASILAAGSVAVFNLAFNLQSFPINVFGISLAIASYPVLTQAFVNGQLKKFTWQLSKTSRRILYLVIPVSILIILLRAQIVRLVLGAGHFDWQDTVLTARALGYFALSIFAQSLIPILARAFYAQQDTKTPVVIAFFTLVINIVASIIFGLWLGVAGLALAYSIASIINALLLWSILIKRMGDGENRKILTSFFKIILISFVMAVFVQMTKYIIAPLVDMQRFWGVLVQFIGACLVGGIVYLAISLQWRLEEVAVLREYFVKIKNRLRNNATRKY